LGTEAGKQKFSDLNLHSKCAEFTGEATRMILEMI